MTEGIEPDLVYNLLAQLGGSATFLVIAWFLYKDQKKTIESKDKELKELNGKVLEAFNENTKSNVELRGEIKESRSLTQKVYDEILRGNRGNS
jgi:hypothetical protein